MHIQPFLQSEPPVGWQDSSSASAAAIRPPNAAPCSMAVSSGDQADRGVVVMRRTRQPTAGRLASSNHDRRPPDLALIHGARCYTGRRIVSRRLA
jgi:hypothetical protein